MEFDQNFQGPQYLSSHVPHTQTMFPSQSSILISPSPQGIVFHPSNTYNHLEDHSKMSVPIQNPFLPHHQHHPMMIASNNNNNNKMNDLHGHRNKGKVLIWDFSQQMMVHSSEASCSNEYELVRDFDQTMQQKKKVVMDTTLAHNIIKGQWTSEQDSALVELVKQFGAKKWSQIAKLLPGRIGKQCRERWHNHLKPNIKKESWSLEEDLILIKAHEEVGNKWSKIAKMLPGRSENTIKNHWNTTKRRQNCNRNNEGSVLHAYIERVTASQQSSKVHKNNNLSTCTSDDHQLTILT